MILKLPSNPNHSRILQEFLVFLLEPGTDPSTCDFLIIILSMEKRKKKKEGEVVEKKEDFSKVEKKEDFWTKRYKSQRAGKFWGFFWESREDSWAAPEHSLRLARLEGREKLPVDPRRAPRRIRDCKPCEMQPFPPFFRIAFHYSGQEFRREKIFRLMVLQRWAQSMA